MGRKKEEGAAAKGQSVISRFFAPKSAHKSGEQSDITAADSTVVWPSPTRLVHTQNRANVHTACKKRLPECSDKASASGSCSKRQNTGKKDEVRHQKFVNVLLSESEERTSSFYGKPPSGNEKYTPLEEQVVALKAKYPDVLLMIEVGYKFRFFGEDAEKAAKVLGIVAFYSHSFLTASIPTFRLHVHVRRLVEAGYKVGVVKQTETAAIKAHGANKTGPFTRDLSALYTKATLEAADYLGGDEIGEKDGAGRVSSYIMCVVEESITGKGRKSGNAGDESRKVEEGVFDTRIGVVAVEASTGDVMHGDFLDNVMRTELEARLLACAPAELLLSASLSSATKKLLLDYAGSTEARVENVSENTYKDGSAAALADFYASKMPSKSEPHEAKAGGGLEVLMEMPSIVVAAFAHVLSYLKQFNLENVLRTGASFRPFVGQQEMMLCPNTLRQLEILRNADGSETGSLFWLMNHTKTAFGARQLRYWVTHPLRDHTLISSRLDAVTEIAESVRRGNRQNERLLVSVLDSLGKLPDVERGITRIYHKTATTSEFIAVIKAVLGASMQFQELKEIYREPALLNRLISAVASPAVVEYANKLITSLNPSAAASGDKLNLFVAGRYTEVDERREKIKSIEAELDGFLPGYERLVKASNLKYLNVSGTPFLIEVPAAQRVPSDWVKVNSTKKTNRYHTPEVLEASDRLALAKEQLAVACSRAWDEFLKEFASYYVEFRACVHALAALDCLHSLAILSCGQGYARPQFVASTEPCFLQIEDGRHPILDAMLQGAFVPNSTCLSEEKERAQIITGPNMGGKSSYIRQVALIVIMAQIGSYVPAMSTKLHVFDAVFTRMGISDSIHKGSSTFFEELSEASTILRKATVRSLVIMDELGRGTSTHDGVAIAYSTLHHLVQNIRCFTLFVTHYLKVTEVVKDFPGIVQSYHMSYLAENTEPRQLVDQVLQKVTFLYKLQPGAASRSFGINVARLAMIPESCVIRAAEKAAMFEESMNVRHARRSEQEKLEKGIRLLGQAYAKRELCSLKAAHSQIKELIAEHGTS